MRIISLKSLEILGAKAIPKNKTICLMVDSERKFFLVPPKQYEKLVEAMEELDDIRVIEERRGDKTVSFEEVFGK